jgi:cyanophycin synthetase
MGDGINNIEELVSIENRDPKRGDDFHSPLKKLIIDDEVIDFLKLALLTPKSVPMQGQFVALCAKSNVSSGGIPIPANDNIHPDNVELAIQAARSLKLDLAGIDLIIPDITFSWKESGAAIIEVNAQPQLGGVTSLHLYPIILKSLIGHDDGRVPIILVIGQELNFDMNVIIEKCQKDMNLKIGFFNEAEDLKRHINFKDLSSYSIGKRFLRDKSFGAFIIQISSPNLLETGLPFDSFDSLIITDDLKGKLDDFLKIFAPACLSKIYVTEEIKLDFSQHKKIEKFFEKLDSKLIDKIIIERLIA